MLCYVKRENELSESFTVVNRVKQGALVSPLLFSIYIDNLFNELKQTDSNDTISHG